MKTHPCLNDINSVVPLSPRVMKLTEAIVAKQLQNKVEPRVIVL